MGLIDEIAQEVESGDEEEVKKKVKKALQENHTALDVIDNGLMKGMGMVGGKFGSGEIFIPEVMIAARALQAGMEFLRPYLQEGKRSSIAKVVLGTVAGDIHDLGKNFVKIMLTANGFEVIDIGIDASAEKFVDAAKEHQPEIIGMSALLTTTMPEMEKVIEALQVNGIRNKLKVILGGAPVNREFAHSIGADFYAEDAMQAVHLLKRAAG